MVADSDHLLQHVLRQALRHVLLVGRRNPLRDLRLIPDVVLLPPGVVSEVLGVVAAAAARRHAKSAHRRAELSRGGP